MKGSLSMPKFVNVFIQFLLHLQITDQRRLRQLFLRPRPLRSFGKNSWNVGNDDEDGVVGQREEAQLVQVFEVGKVLSVELEKVDGRRLLTDGRRNVDLRGHQLKVGQLPERAKLGSSVRKMVANVSDKVCLVLQA